MIKSICAGFAIAIGTQVYLNAPSKTVGAVLFSIGLIVILEYGLNLYTGKVGALSKWADIPYLLIVFAGNTIGCMVMGAFPSTAATAIWTAKLAIVPAVVCIKGFLCGMLIQFCVHQHQTKSREVSILSCLIAIPAFILGGLEHSIADICFMISAEAWSWESIELIVCVALANALGAIVMKRIEEI